MVPEHTVDVYAFICRADIGGSLMANRNLKGRIHQLRRLLPVHLITFTLKNNYGVSAAFGALIAAPKKQQGDRVGFSVETTGRCCVTAAATRPSKTFAVSRSILRKRPPRTVR